MDLQIGMCFTGDENCFTGRVIIKKIDGPNNILHVRCTKKTGDKYCSWDEEWNLQHTMWGFENGSYFLKDFPDYPQEDIICESTVIPDKFESLEVNDTIQLIDSGETFVIDRIFKEDGLVDMTATKKYKSELGMNWNQKFFSIKLVNFIIISKGDDGLSLESLSIEEIEMIEKGKNHWKSMDVLTNQRGGYITSDTIKLLIDYIVEDVWLKASNFYNKENNTDSEKRKQAMEWWNNLRDARLMDGTKDKGYFTDKHFGVSTRSHESLTGREIQQIYENQHHK